AAKIGWDPEKAAAWRQWRSEREASPGGGMGFEGFHVDFGDIFGDIFGEAFRGARRRAGVGPRPGEDIHTSITVELGEVVRGTSRLIEVEKPTTCSRCNGSGRENPHPPDCSTCGGTGRVRTTRGNVAFSGVCPTCHGTGLEP